MKFKSLVIMDLESSGLPAPGLKPKITELSLVGVIVDHLTLLKRGEGLPRVLQKCNLCFYPKKRIDFEATEITGLDNFLLEEIPPWNKEACSLLANFLNRLPQPICFIAHNGMKFDFPLLKAEIFSQREDVLQDIDCADSLLAFRAILPMYKEVAISESTSVGMPSPELNTIGDYTVVISEQSTVDSSLHLNFDIHIENMQKKNETTPKQTKRLGSGLNPPPVKRRHFNDDENTEGKNPLIRKKLFGGEEKLTSYKLCDIYRHIHNRELNNGHRAETDTLALLECIIRTAPEFLAWLENNHLKFSKVPCMW